MSNHAVPMSQSPETAGQDSASAWWSYGFADPPGSWRDHCLASGGDGDWWAAFDRAAEDTWNRLRAIEAMPVARSIIARHSTGWHLEQATAFLAAIRGQAEQRRMGYQRATQYDRRVNELAGWLLSHR